MAEGLRANIKLKFNHLVHALLLLDGANLSDNQTQEVLTHLARSPYPTNKYTGKFKKRNRVEHMKECLGKIDNPPKCHIIKDCFVRLSKVSVIPSEKSQADARDEQQDSKPNGNVHSDEQQVSKPNGNFHIDEQQVSKPNDNAHSDEQQVSKPNGNAHTDEQQVSKPNGNVHSDERQVSNTIGNVHSDDHQVSNTIGNVYSDERQVFKTKDISSDYIGKKGAEISLEASLPNPIDTAVSNFTGSTDIKEEPDRVSTEEIAITKEESLAMEGDNSIKATSWCASWCAILETSSLEKESVIKEETVPHSEVSPLKGVSSLDIVGPAFTREAAMTTEEASCSEDDPLIMESSFDIEEGSEKTKERAESKASFDIVVGSTFTKEAALEEEETEHLLKESSEIFVEHRNRNINNILFEETSLNIEYQIKEEEDAMFGDSSPVEDASLLFSDYDQFDDFDSTYSQNYEQHTDAVAKDIKIPREITGLTCGQCDYVTKRNSDLMMHIKSRHDFVRYPCDLCEYKSTRDSDLRRHEKTVHKLQRLSPGKRKKRKTVDNHSMYLNEKSLKIYTDSISEAKTKMEVALGVYGHTFLEQSSSIREVMPQESNKPAEHQGVEDASLMILDNNDQLEDFDSSRFRNSEQHKETETVPEEPIEIAEHPEQDNKSEEKKKYLSPRKAKERACLEISSTATDIGVVDSWIMSDSEGDSEFQCNECEYNGTSVSGLKRHREAVHLGIKEFKCDQCKYAVYEKSKLKLHKEKRHLGIRYPCDQCAHIATEARHLASHKKKEHSTTAGNLVSEIVGNLHKPKFACNICRYSSISLNLLEQHQKETHGNRVSCDQCVYTFSDSFKLKHHKESFHDGIRYPCDLCAFKSTTQRGLKQHKKKFHHTCDLCEHKLEDQYTLSVHIKECSAGEKIAVIKDNNHLICDQCGYEAITDSRLAAHMTTKHGLSLFPGVECSVISKKRYLCDLCGYVAEGVYALNKHTKGFHKILPYKCDQCQYTASNLSQLREHKKTKHEGVRHFCDKCDRSFTSLVSLKIHKRGMHEGIVYNCDQCEYKTFTMGTLSAHIKRVHDRVTFNCDFCEYSYTSRQRPNIHKKSKHGSKYPCDQCESVLSNPMTLKTHKKWKHEGVRYSCDECEYVGTMRSLLMRHKMKKHTSK